MATRKYEVRSTRIPLELDARIKRIVADGGRYKSIAQFIELAVRRLATFEEGEMERKQEGKLGG